MQSSSIPPEKSDESILKQAGAYIQTQAELLKYKAVDNSADLLSSFLSNIVVILLVIVCVFFLSIGCAFWIGLLLKNTYCGFFIIAGMYGLIAILLYIFRSKWLKTPFNDHIIKFFLK